MHLHWRVLVPGGERCPVCTWRAGEDTWRYRGVQPGSGGIEVTTKHLEVLDVLEVSTKQLEDGDRPEVQPAVEQLPVAPGDGLRLAAGGEGLRGRVPGL